MFNFVTFLLLLLSNLFLLNEGQRFDEDSTRFFATSTENSFSTLKSDEDISTLDYSTIQFNSKEDEWINANQTNLFWKEIQQNSSYELQSENQCRNEMCSNQLIYNGRFNKHRDGCLTFILSILGQPIGQIWIEEDQRTNSLSQKIQLTNSQLRIEHSFQSNIRLLTIHSRVFLPNRKSDRIILSNLSIHFNGPCSSKFLPQITTEYFQQFTSEIPSTSFDFFTNPDETTSERMNISSSKYITEKNILWLIFLIMFVCVLMIVLSILYGIWSIMSHYRYVWNIPYEYPIGLISKRSISSSNEQLQTIEEIWNDIHQNENSFDQITIDSFQTNLSDIHSYF